MFLLASFLFSFGVVLYFLLEQRIHHAKLTTIKYRIHVNGIRGKSSVTRLAASVLREAKIETLGKTTGSDTNIIDATGKDVPVIRQGPANIFENVLSIQKYVTDKTQAIVFECMAIQPMYQKFLEDKVMRANIGIITNVWEDHVAEMGQTLPEIAHSLSSTIPTNGYLISAEDNPEIQAILQENCRKKHTKYINALNYRVKNSYIQDFHYFEHKENISIGLALADLLNIPERVALRGMKKVKPDPGATTIEKYSVKGKKVIWVNLFAANDRQSVIKSVELVHARFKKLAYATTSLLNNRHDRPERAQQFVDIVTRDIKSDYVVTIGELEKQVIHSLKRNNHKNIISLAKHTEATGKDLLERIGRAVKEDTILLLGLGNIHTDQAQNILQYLSTKPQEAR